MYIMEFPINVVGYTTRNDKNKISILFCFCLLSKSLSLSECI